jgi:hypothetical protein
LEGVNDGTQRRARGFWSLARTQHRRRSALSDVLWRAKQDVGKLIELHAERHAKPAPV